MMRLFCAYAFTGEKAEEVKKRMRLVVEVLNKNGHEAYCNLFDEDFMKIGKAKQLIDHGLGQLRNYDGLVAIVASERRSEGMLIEVGAALAQNKPVYVFQYVSAKGKSYLPELAAQSFEWHDHKGLTEALSRL